MEDFEQLDFYQLLGVTYDASTEEIKRAYRQQIARYHPDRYGNASPAEQAYASQRSQRINEAYRVLSGSRNRQTYDRSQAITPSQRHVGMSDIVRRAAARVNADPPAPAPRDHQSELYEQAQEHLDSGRYLQAIATLRQLQQINPFYRDSAALLARAEAASRGKERAAASTTPPSQPTSRGAPLRFIRIVLFSGIGLIALIGIVFAIVVLRPRQATVASPPPGGEPTITTAAPTTIEPGLVIERTQTPEPTFTAVPALTPTIEPTTAPVLTATPELTATSEPTVESEVTATPEVVASPVPPPISPTIATESPIPVQAVENGPILFTHDFNGPQGWAVAQGNGWSVGAFDGVYRINVEPGIGNIWSYRTVLDTSDFMVGVDTQVRGGGAGGMLLRFVDAGTYLAFLVDPREGSYLLEQQRGGSSIILLQENSDAIRTGEEATNRLVARLVGNTIQLFINNQAVADLAVNAEQTPLYGLVAIARDAPAEATFDNLEVRAIE